MNSITASLLGTGQPSALLGMMSGAEWDRRMLALPAPSNDRDEERSVHRNSGYQRALEINRKAQAELDKRIENYRRFGTANAPQWTITVHNVTSKKTRVFFVSSATRLRDGSEALQQSVMVADSEAQAKRQHRQRRKEDSRFVGCKEINIAAFAPGDWSTSPGRAA